MGVTRARQVRSADLVSPLRSMLPLPETSAVIRGALTSIFISPAPLMCISKIFGVVDRCLPDDVAGARDIDIIVHWRGDIDLEIAGRVEVEVVAFREQ